MCALIVGPAAERAPKMPRVDPAKVLDPAIPFRWGRDASLIQSLRHISEVLFPMRDRREHGRYRFIARDIRFPAPLPSTVW